MNVSGCRHIMPASFCAHPRPLSFTEFRETVSFGLASGADGIKWGYSDVAPGRGANCDKEMCPYEAFEDVPAPLRYGRDSAACRLPRRQTRRLP